MNVEIMTFDGPRSGDALEASQRAGRERIAPLIAANPELRTRLIGGFRGLGPDCAECVVVLAHDASALDELERVVTTSELLPGEDPALLPGPSRVDRYVASDVFGWLSKMLAGAER
jgi:hypothetical protein